MYFIDIGCIAKTVTAASAAINVKMITIVFLSFFLINDLPAKSYLPLTSEYFSGYDALIAFHLSITFKMDDLK